MEYLFFCCTGILLNDHHRENLLEMKYDAFIFFWYECFTIFDIFVHLTLSLFHFVFCLGEKGFICTQYYLFLCSEDDTDWVCENFNYELREGNQDPTFDMEEKQGFRILEQERDFLPGTNKMLNLERGMLQSRRMIFILSA